METELPALERRLGYHLMVYICVTNSLNLLHRVFSVCKRWSRLCCEDTLYATFCGSICGVQHGYPLVRLFRVPLITFDLSYSYNKCNMVPNKDVLLARCVNDRVPNIKLSMMESTVKKLNDGTIYRQER